MKKTYATSLIGVLALSVFLAGCGDNNNNGKASESAPASPAQEMKSSGGDGGAKVKLSVYNSTNDKATQDELQKIGAEYTKEHPNVTFDWQFPAKDYESILKMKMAANDMPDIFDTHGWSQVRYGNFVADLADQSWVGNLSESFKPIVTDAQGKVYTLPLNAAKDGITYNKDVLDKYGVSVPKTLDELIAAGEKIKNESKGDVIPFFFSSTDASSLAQFFDYFATSLLISPAQNESAALLDGTFDWSKWTPLAAKFKEIYDKGLMNEDVFTIRITDRPQLFAQGKIAFSFSAPSFIPDALQVNPDLKVGIMPVPSMVAGDEPNFSGGERITMSASKDGKNLEAAKAVIEYFAQPEILKRVSEVSGVPTAMTNVNPDLGIYTEFYDQYKDVRIFPYFDRAYLPSGMWDIMKTTSAQLLTGDLTPEASSEVYKKEVERLKAQAK